MFRTAPQSISLLHLVCLFVCVQVLEECVLHQKENAITGSDTKIAIIVFSKNYQSVRGGNVCQKAVICHLLSIRVFAEEIENTSSPVKNTSLWCSDLCSLTSSVLGLLFLHPTMLITVQTVFNLLRNDQSSSHGPQNSKVQK